MDPPPGRTTILDSGIVRSLLLLSLLIGIAGGTPVDARGEVYKWVDENGEAHYTTDPAEIPRRLRRQILGAAGQREIQLLDEIPPPLEASPDLAAVPPAHGPAGSEAQAGDPLALIPPPRGAAPAGDPLALIPPPRDSVGRAAPARDPLAAIPPARKAETASTGASPAAFPAPARATPAEELDWIPAPARAGESAPEESSLVHEPEPFPSEPAPGPPPVEAAPPLDLEAFFLDEPEPESAEIRELQSRIDLDREQLRELLAAERLSDESLTDDPRLREIAERLPRLQAELEALRAERDR